MKAVAKMRVSLCAILQTRKVDKIVWFEIRTLTEYCEPYPPCWWAKMKKQLNSQQRMSLDMLTNSCLLWYHSRQSYCRNLQQATSNCLHCYLALLSACTSCFTCIYWFIHSRGLRYLATEREGYLRQKNHPMVKPTLRVRCFCLLLFTVRCNASGHKHWDNLVKFI